MRNVILIMEREWKAFFHTPFAMIVLPLYLLLCGSYFVANLDTYMAFATPNESLTAVHGLNLMGHFLGPFFGSLMNIFIFVIPLITMRTFAEERKSGTYELLVSYPMHPWEILLGKYLGAMVIVMLLVVLSFVYFAIVMWKGHPHVPQILSTYLGMILFLMLYVAIGVLASLMTENQLVAAIISYTAFFLTYLVAYLAFISFAPLDKVFANFLVNAHVESFKRGLIYLGDIVVFFVLTGVCLLAAHHRLRKHYGR